jgi:hypothetical protein
VEDPSFAAFAAAAGELACFRHLEACRFETSHFDVVAASAALAEVLFWWRTLDEADPDIMAEVMAGAGLSTVRPGLVWARNVATHRSLSVGRHRVERTFGRRDYTAWLTWTQLPAPRAKPDVAALQVSSYREHLSDVPTERVVRRLSLVFGRL